LWQYFKYLLYCDLLACWILGKLKLLYGKEEGGKVRVEAVRQRWGKGDGREENRRLSQQGGEG
jgi:hypothetical protein